MLNIQRIKHLRPLLTEDITQVLVLGLVISHIDYCNLLFVGLPEIDISKLQRIQMLVPNWYSINQDHTVQQKH